MKLLIINDGIEEKDEASYKVSQIYENILKELEVEVKVLHLAKKIPTMQAFNILLEDVNGIIIINTVRWVGIGATMQTFLDQCYAFNKDIFKGMYGLILTLARECGEELAENCLVRSWLSLGGRTPETLKGIVTNHSIDEQQDILKAIEKKLEDYFRYVGSKRPCLPSSLHNTLQVNHVQHNSESKVSKKEQQIDSEQRNVKKVETATEQKQPKEANDIFEITKIFKNKLKKAEQGLSIESIESQLKSRYKPSDTFVNDLLFSFKITGIKEQRLMLILEKKGIHISETFNMDSQIQINIEDKYFKQIIEGNLTLENAFVLGKAIVKGQMALLSIFDDCFKA